MLLLCYAQQSYSTTLFRKKSMVSFPGNSLKWLCMILERNKNKNARCKILVHVQLEYEVKESDKNIHN